MNRKFRKKPVVIEAVELKELTIANIQEVIEFLAKEPLTFDNSSAKQQKFYDYCEEVKEVGSMLISTLEGDMKASVGDFIIKGVNGEFYPCKPDIFAKTYEKVEEERTDVWHR